MAYIGNQPVLQSTEFREEFFPTSNQTAFTTGGFHPNAVSVYRNGVLLAQNGDYSKGTDNVTITLTNAAVAGDIVVIEGRRDLTQGTVTEQRYEEVIANSATTVTPPFAMIPDFTDVYFNGVLLSAGRGNNAQQDYTINQTTRVISFTTAPANGDLIAVVARGSASTNTNQFADQDDVYGIHATATTTYATSANQLTSVSFNSGYSLSDIAVGDYVVGERILPGTTVDSITGSGPYTINLIGPNGSDALSATGADLSGDPVVFYNATKALSAGTVAGGLCRAWVNFNASTQTIRSSYNVSSISYGTGDFSIYFNNDMPDANYSVVGSNLWARWFFGIDSTFTSYVRIKTYDEGAGSFGNPTIVCVAIFR